MKCAGLCQNNIEVPRAGLRNGDVSRNPPFVDAFVSIIKRARGYLLGSLDACRKNFKSFAVKVRLCIEDDGLCSLRRRLLEITSSVAWNSNTSLWLSTRGFCNRYDNSILCNLDSGGSQTTSTSASASEIPCVRWRFICLHRTHPMHSRSGIQKHKRHSQLN